MKHLLGKKVKTERKDVMGYGCGGYLCIGTCSDTCAAGCFNSCERTCKDSCMGTCYWSSWAPK